MGPVSACCLNAIVPDCTPRRGEWLVMALTPKTRFMTLS